MRFFAVFRQKMLILNLRGCSLSEQCLGARRDNIFVIGHYIEFATTGLKSRFKTIAFVALSFVLFVNIYLKNDLFF